MKKIIPLIIMFLVLTGCNDEDQVTDPPQNAPAENDGNIANDDLNENNNNTTDDDLNENDQNVTDDDLNENDDNATDDAPNDSLFSFTSFELDIDYEGDKDFDVEYENDQDGMEAEIEDDIHGEKLSGDEAFEKLRPIFETLTFTKETEKEEVISEVLDAFNVNNNFTKFELEVRFDDGTEKEYNKQ